MKNSSQPININPKEGIIILTNFGMIEGDIINTIALNRGQEIHKSFFEAINELSEKENIKKFDENSFITIYNAKVTPYQNPNIKLTFNQLTLFTDQITGFTYGMQQIS